MIVILIEQKINITIVILYDKIKRDTHVQKKSGPAGV